MIYVESLGYTSRLNSLLAGVFEPTAAINAARMIAN